MRKETVALLNITLALALIGVLMVYSAATVTGIAGSYESSHPLHALRYHGLRLGLGLVALTVAARFDYHRFRSRLILWPMLVAILGLLVTVLILQEERLGATRWLSIANQSFQPSDLAKAALIIMLAVKLSENNDHIGSFFRGYVPPMMIIGLICGLIVLQRDIGTPAVMGAVAIIMMLVAGSKWFHIVLSIGPAIAVFMAYVSTNPHAQERLYSFRDPWKYSQDEGYQLIQSLWAFARGGLFGQGLGAGQQKLGHLPEASSDFIFASLGEEMGLVGTLGVVILFALFLIVAVRIAMCAPDLLGTLLGAGIAALIAVQALLNMGVTIGLLPTKGLTLPFISAGGTALVINLGLVGILLNVGMQGIEPKPVARKAARAT